MRAVIQHEYGTHEVLSVDEVDIPEPKKDEVRIRVHAAAVHAGDTLVMRGHPKALRLMFGIGGPRQATPGLEVAGVVDAIGAQVTEVRVGDRVFGEGSGALAEYAIAKAGRLAVIPSEMSFAEAAALPVSAVTGLMAMRDVAKVQPGEKVLVIGASGGVGSFAVQVAKHLGAEVTAVCSARNIELVSSLGADHVVDYTKGSVLDTDVRFDVILDNVASHSLEELEGILVPGGRILSNNGTSGGVWFGPLGRMARAAWRNLTTKTSYPQFVAMATRERLEDLVELIDAGALRPVIGSTRGFDQAIEAVAEVESGHAVGKVVVELVPSRDIEGVAK